MVSGGYSKNSGRRELAYFAIRVWWRRNALAIQGG
jgi:hypothetical protein